MNRFLSFILLVMLWCGVADNARAKKGNDTAINIIFETDMGNDVDDALALDMLYKYMEQGRVKLLAVSTNKGGAESPWYIDIMNTWYGHKNVPIGCVKEGDGVPCGNVKNYAAAVCEMKDNVGKPLFKHTCKDYMESTQLYRKTLSKQKDASVTIVSVGFSTNLAALLASGADKYSELSGRELVAKKVKQLVIMGGCFNEEKGEYNIVCDVKSAQKVMQEWPTPIVASPAEVGEGILYPGASIESDFLWAVPAHPMVEGYKAYLPMPYDRPTWDLTAVLYAVEGSKDFTVSKPGTISVDDKGVTRFAESVDGRHRYLTTIKDQNVSILARMKALILTMPKKYAKR